jgi:hypothetical protein
MENRNNAQLSIIRMAQDRNQIYITLSDQANEDYRHVADYLGMPVATLLRQILESHHQGREFGALIERVRATKQTKKAS